MDASTSSPLSASPFSPRTWATDPLRLPSTCASAAPLVSGLKRARRATTRQVGLREDLVGLVAQAVAAVDLQEAALVPAGLAAVEVAVDPAACLVPRIQGTNIR